MIRDSIDSPSEVNTIWLVTWKSFGFWLVVFGTLAVLEEGCTATTHPATGDLRADLRHKDPRVRMNSAFLSAEAGRRDLVDVLILNLSDQDESVRFLTAIALKRLTGQDFGFRSPSSLKDREEAIARWNEWFQSSSFSASKSEAMP